MRENIRRVLTILIGFLHDFAAGCWAATVLSIYWLDRTIAEYAEVADVLENIQRGLFYIGLICVATVFITGAGRTFTYVSNVYGKDAEKTRRQLLIVKHIILFIVFGAGIYWQYIMTFR